MSTKKPRARKGSGSQTITKGYFPIAIRRMSRAEMKKITEDDVLEAWHRSNKPEHNRASAIAKYMGYTDAYIRTILRKHGINIKK